MFLAKTSFPIVCFTFCLFVFIFQVNMRPVVSFVSLLLLIIFFASCYKVEVEKNALPQGFSVAQIIGTWKITAVTSDKAFDWDGNGTAETDIYSTYTDCQKDNLHQFNQDYSASFKFSCSDTEAGTWRLDGTITLVWAAAGSPTIFEKIVYLTTDTMKTERIITQANGTSYTVTTTWKFQ